MTISVLAPDLVPGDRLISTGIGGVSGLVTRVHVDTDYVGVWVDGETVPHSLNRIESCTVERPAPYRNVEEVMHAIVGGR